MYRWLIMFVAQNVHSVATACTNRYETDAYIHVVVKQISCFQTTFHDYLAPMQSTCTYIIYIMSCKTLMCSVNLMCEGGVEQVASLCVHDPLRLASGA